MSKYCKHLCSIDLFKYFIRFVSAVNDIKVSEKNQMNIQYICNFRYICLYMQSIFKDQRNIYVFNKKRF